MRWILALITTLTLLSSARAVDILYTGCTNGRIENCRCPNDPLGALEKRLPEMDRRRKLGDVLLVDSGDFMPGLVDTIAAETVLDIYALTRYDAVTLGDQELIEGPALVRETLQRLPVVSCNLRFKDGTPMGAAYRLVERGGTTFFITGVMDSVALKFIDPELIGYVTLLDPDSSLASVVRQAPEGAKVVVLSHSGMDRDRLNANAWQGVDLIVGGHSQTVIEGVYDKGRIPVVQAGGNARYLGVATFRGPHVRAELVEIRPELPDDDRVIELLMKMRAEKRRLRQK